MRARWIIAALGLLCAALPASAQTTVTFDYTGGAQTWVVPAGVTQVSLQAWGAQGGASYYLGINGFQDDGGLGGYTSGELAVTPGDTLYIFVGGQPTPLNSTPISGGFNGGGDGGQYGGGGGGASDVRVGGTALTDRVLVAGGGGGGNSGNPDHGTGGGGGGLSGLPGINLSGGFTPAGGGTQVAGGAAGSNDGGTLAQPGQLGSGGSTSSYHFAGGGGGYYGGGSAYAAGGGGGSSYIGGVLSGSTTAEQKVGNGQVVISFQENAAIPALDGRGLALFVGLMALAALAVLRRQLAA
ncbi:MAG: glycine rich domain-containing protein [Thermoanaerobaculales bacterium]|jgi:hypothetical protein|nr:glycine rich domain-containing protein [Thermoanaerobaculales bacterium]